MSQFNLSLCVFQRVTCRCVAFFLFFFAVIQVKLEELGRGAGGVVFKAVHVPTMTVKLR
jgi:hypothetical protein